MKKLHLKHVWFLLVTGSCLSFTSAFNMPVAWTTDFVVEAGMQNPFAHTALSVTYTYDSCIYTNTQGDNISRHSFALTDSDRTEILYHMQSLEVTKIGYTFDPYNVDEQASRSYLCMHHSKEFCIEEGPFSKLKGERPGNYYKAFEYLFAFAERHQQTASN